jgi:hypothetical protein
LSARNVAAANPIVTKPQNPPRDHLVGDDFYHFGVVRHPKNLPMPLGRQYSISPREAPFDLEVQPTDYARKAPVVDDSVGSAKRTQRHGCKRPAQKPVAFDEQRFRTGARGGACGGDAGGTTANHQYLRLSEDWCVARGFA